MFTVDGLPAHPLLVHAVVVLIPLSALGAVAVAIRPRWNRAYAPLVAFGAVSAALTAALAKLAGDQLIAAINVSPEYAGLLSEHGRYGVYTASAALVFAILAVGTAVLGRRREGGLPRIVGGLSALVGVVAVVMVAIAGHLGSTSVWGSIAGG